MLIYNKLQVSSVELQCVSLVAVKTDRPVFLKGDCHTMHCKQGHGGH